MTPATSKDNFGAVILEAENRKMRVSKIEVVTVPRDGKTPIFGIPGAMVALVAPTGSKVLAGLRSGLKDGGSGIESFRSHVIENYKQGKSLDSAATAKAMIAAPVLADIRYGTRTLNSGIFLPEHLDCAIAIFPYNGGRLAAEGFELVEYFKDGASANLEALIVASAPELNEAEAAALKLVPENDLVRNVGVPLDCETTYWAVAVVGGAFATAIGLFVAVAISVFRMQATHLTEEQIQKAGPAASARALLRLRREALLDATVAS
ncbi:MAG TPA: hypothetical protein VGD59_06735 [Acidisarcina sp.]